MEPFGCVSTPLAVAESLGKGGSFLARKSSDYRNAEKDSQHFQRRMQHLVENLGHLDRLPPEIRQTLSTPIQSAMDIVATFPEDLSIVKKRDKFLWIAIWKTKIEDAIKKLQEIEYSSNLTIVAESMKDICALRSKLSDLSDSSKQILLQEQQWVNCMTEQQRQQQQYNLQFAQLLHALHSHTRYGKHIASQRYTFNDAKLAQFLRITLRLACFQQEHQPTTTDIYFQYLFVHRHIIPEDTPIIDACKDGDGMKIRKILAARQAYPNDCTPDSLTLLRYAIRGKQPGAVEAVEALLENGADPNLTFGTYETSPLNVAFLFRSAGIVRALLKAGADFEYVNGRTWKTLSYLWDPDPIPTRCEEIPQILDICASKDSEVCCFRIFEAFGLWDHADTTGWAPIHRAAAFGRGDHIKKLRSLRVVNMKQRTALTKWTPLHCAVRYGNTSTFDVLWTSSDLLIPEEMKDSRGWDLLHLAAASGCPELISRLLSLGFDPNQVTDEASICVPEELEYKELTPRTIAEHYGHDQVYDEVLKSFGLEVVNDFDARVINSAIRSHAME